MYHILTDGRSIPVERLQWVKLQPNDVYVPCEEDEGHGILVENEIYHISGKQEIDRPAADIVWKDDVLALTEDNTAVMGALVEVYENTLAQRSESTQVMLALTELYELLIGG